MANYLYNGIELPPLPEWDKTTYPYAYIYRIMPLSRWCYKLHLTTEPFYGTDINGDYCIGRHAGDITYKFYEGDAAWDTEPTTYPNDGVVVSLNENLIWSDFDILNTDGSVYLAASDPVPVKTEDTVLTLTSTDLYKKVNGQLVKHTLYRKVNGELVLYDEYAMLMNE